jgi:hypothetical protein
MIAASLDKFFDETVERYPKVSEQIEHVRGICHRLDEDNDVEFALLTEIEDIICRCDRDHLLRCIEVYKRFGRMLDALKAEFEPRTN